MTSNGQPHRSPRANDSAERNRIINAFLGDDDEATVIVITKEGLLIQSGLRTDTEIVGGIDNDKLTALAIDHLKSGLEGKRMIDAFNHYWTHFANR